MKVKAKGFRLVLGNALMETRPLVATPQRYMWPIIPIAIATIFSLGVGVGYMIRGSEVAPQHPAASTLSLAMTEDTPPAIPFLPPPDNAASEGVLSIPLPVPDIHTDDIITGNKAVDDILRAATNNNVVRDTHLSVTNDTPGENADEGMEEEKTTAADAPPDIGSLRAELKRNPNDAAARRDLAETLAQSKSFDALAELQKMAHATPDDAAIEAAMAQFLARHQDVDTAITHMTRAIHLNPSDLNYRFTLAVLYDRKGQGEKALALYQQIIQALPDLGTAAPANLPMASIRARARYLASDLENSQN